MTNILSLLNTYELQLQQLLEHLHRSYKQCKNIDFSKELSLEDLDYLEALTARFARTSDIFTQKYLKTLGLSLGEETKTFLDLALFFEKLELVSSDHLMKLRTLRNEIAHEYSIQDMNLFFKEITISVPELFKIIQCIETYKKGKFQ